MERKRKMLYLMNVNWSWIKQRPHFLAIQLSDFFDTTVLYPSSIRYLTRKDDLPRNVSGIFQLPFGRFSLIRRINDFILGLRVRKKLNASDILWISDPAHYHIIKNFVKPGTTVVYDCMDDLVAFDRLRSDDRRNKVFFMEKQLVERADRIMVSSLRLKSVLEERYGLTGKSNVINNAINGSFIDASTALADIPYPEKESCKDLLYFGTIAEWFDFGLITGLLDRFPDLRLILLGPKSSSVPEHARIRHIGPVPHHQLRSWMLRADALIMPFVVNDLILAVDPVKLYEYIASDKPVITCHYPEIDRFSDFVYSYSSPGELFGLIEKLMQDNLPVKPREERMAFLADNTWRRRAEKIYQLL